jgi:hypothetical protein
MSHKRKYCDLSEVSPDSIEVNTEEEQDNIQNYLCPFLATDLIDIIQEYNKDILKHLMDQVNVILRERNIHDACVCYSCNELVVDPDIEYLPIEFPGCEDRPHCSECIRYCHSCGQNYAPDAWEWSHSECDPSESELE